MARALACCEQHKTMEYQMSFFAQSLCYVVTNATIFLLNLFSRSRPRLRSSRPHRPRLVALVRRRARKRRRCGNGEFYIYLFDICDCE